MSKNKSNTGEFFIGTGEPVVKTHNRIKIIYN